MLRRIISLIKKEFAVIWRDPKSRALIIFPPLMQLLIFAHAVTMEVKNIDVAFWDKSQTPQSRNLAEMFHSSKWFRKIYFIQSDVELKKDINTQKVQMALIIPSDFAKNILNKKNTDIQIIVDGRQTNSAAIGSSYATEIIKNYETEFAKFNIKKTGSINFQVRNKYNPNLIFMWYTVVSLMAILALVITLLLTALSIARERERGTFDQLIVSPLSPFEILIGKIIPPLCIAVLLTIFMMFIAINCFKTPFTGSFFVFIIATIFSLLSIVGIGLFISSICFTQQQAILGCFLFQSPAVILCGFVSPIEDMPKIFQYLTCINPLRFFMVITKGLFFKNMPTSEVLVNLFPLMIIAIFTLSLATWSFKRQLD